MSCGIYMIQNLINNKIYIGQSIDIESRWVDHKLRLNSNRHGNPHLQRSWNKYGEVNFEFTILCKCEEKQLNTLEQYFIFEFMSYDSRIGYNKKYGGNSNKPTEEIKNKISNSHKGFKHSLETIEKISRTRQGISSWNKDKSNIYSKETLDKMRLAKLGKIGKDCVNSIPIVQIDKDSKEIIRLWDCAADAERYGGFDSHLIRRCCKGTRKSHKGYIWKNLTDLD